MKLLKPKTHNLKPNSGFTLIEILIAIALLVIIGYSTYLIIASSLEVISRNQWRLEAVAVVGTEIETIRNMKFEDIGIEGGSPPGKLEAQKAISVRGLEFDLKTTVRNIDDPFDGTLGGSPNDTAPADYKLVEFEIDCTNCPTKFQSIFMTTTVAPENLETSTNNGSLFINVFDAGGLPVVGADVLVENFTASPTISISDETNTDGILQLVDIPTSTQSYEVTVSKNGYSSEQTYELGDPSNPNPVKVWSIATGSDKPLNTSRKEAMTLSAGILSRVMVLLTYWPRGPAKEPRLRWKLANRISKRIWPKLKAPDLIG